MEEQIVDDGYKNIRIRMDSTIIATQEIIDHVSISYGCTDGSAPAFGGTYSPHCEIEINSNDIMGDENLSHIRMGKQFYIECELTEGTYTNMGVFEINQPPMYTDDYSISFSGEGMLGSVLDRTKMDWSLMQSYSSKGIITVNQALKMFEDQFGISVSMRSDTESDYGSAKVIVPLKLRKWKKGVAFKKRFVKITAREWLAGLATLMMGNVVEYGNTISIVTIGEAWDNGTVTEGKYFSEDSYVSDYQSEKIPYAPNSLILNTYETLPVKTKSKTKTTTHGFCYIEECTSRSVYSHIDIDQKNPNKYNVYVDCQWIGKSFETFYYNGGDPYEETDMEDDYPSYNIMASKFAYVPCSFEFSGWHEMFTPGKFVQIQTSQKNTETQETSYSYVYAYIMEMTLNWDGTITVNVSSSYNGDSASVTVTIGHDDVADAWNSGTNIEEQATEEISLPSGKWTVEKRSSAYGYSFPWQYSFLHDDAVHMLSYATSGSPTHAVWDGTNVASSFEIPYNTNNIYGATSYNGSIYILYRITNNNHYDYELYKYDSDISNWTLINTMSTSSSNFVLSHLFVYNDRLCTFKSIYGYYYLESCGVYYLEDDEWTHYFDVDYAIASSPVSGDVTVIPNNDELYVIGSVSYLNALGNIKTILHWDGLKWDIDDTLPLTQYSYLLGFAYDNHIYISGYNNTRDIYVKQYDEWFQVSSDNLGYSSFAHEPVLFQNKVIYCHQSIILSWNPNG